MNILYVDDEKELTEVASIFFKEEGLPMDTCNDPDEALELISKKKYDLVITDLKMPRGSGIDLITKARAGVCFGGRVILLTGHFDPVNDDGIIDLVVYKPVDLFKLLDKVRLLLSLDLQ